MRRIGIRGRRGKGGEIHPSRIRRGPARAWGAQGPPPPVRVVCCANVCGMRGRIRAPRGGVSASGAASMPPLGLRLRVPPCLGGPRPPAVAPGPRPSPGCGQPPGVPRLRRGSPPVAAYVPAPWRLGRALQSGRRSALPAGFLRSPLAVFARRLRLWRALPRGLSGRPLRAAARAGFLPLRGRGARWAPLGALRPRGVGVRFSRIRWCTHRWKGGIL